ncbi:SusC/RagA family TonB-linked outer membrane protein [Parabacteroides goldsteinii DSM 19448 = WAL 12034]|jgi:tonB-linked outer membrane protein, susC/ragA family|uniref:Carbohydrate-binding protein SusC n=3 Tax=Parabacteroides goldsteinii TaxID=328812 RepID=A0A0J6CSQ9_9BACT|nr:SusC/RagA family TonB-linked outer membrane protein [Parabacteroides goldsteinii DSM 19448 = WAL 12034]KMM35164.1 carbohydrate-binding protein SusC [Parabacteroides goldsteinii]
MKSFFTTFKVFGICFLLNPMSPSSVFAETNDKSSDFPLENMGQNTVVSQKRLVTGVVLDSQGEPVVGANVFEKGEKTNGTITDIDGKFSLNVSDNATLVISFVGFKNQEIAVKGRDKIDIRLADDSELLDEVVVVGYMTQKKGLVTGAVSSMKMDEKLNTLPTTSAGNILVGKLAGVSVSTPNGLPGAAPSISIRTGSSWNDQNVTYVIDGVVRGGGDFNNLSPNEIEDITVLKDAASAAIYGSRSAGGVIIVTTKKGTRGKPVFNYSYGYSIDTRTKNSDLTSGVEAAELYGRINGEADPAGWAWSQEEIDHIRTINNGWGYDQLDAVWRNPVTQTHNFSVNGGSEKVRYFGAASYVKQEGFLKPYTYDKYNIRMNVTADITKDLEVFAGLAVYNTFQGNAVFENAEANYGKLRVWQPDQPVYTDSGKHIDFGWIANNGASVDGKGGYNKSQMLKPQAVISATYKAPFLKGLSAKISYSRSWVHDLNKIYYTNYDLYQVKKSGTHNHIFSTKDEDIIGTRKTTWVGKDYIQRKSSWSGDKQFNVQLSYENVFNNLHRVSGTLVTEWYEGDGASVHGGRETFPVYMTDQFWAASSARADTWGGGDTDWQSGRFSYIGQFSYSYADKYLLSFSFREDGSMNFAPSQRWGFFPAGSLGWVISEESFFNKSAIQFLKLRASVGLTGNDSVGGWQWQESYKSGSSAYFGSSPSKSVGITYGSVVNPNLTWEKALSYNVGADVNFLNHWTVSADYWYRNSYDILGSRQNTLPNSFSLTMPAENYGEIHAQGFDLQLGYHGNNKDFSYYGNLTMSYGWNKTIKQDYAENARWIDIPVGKSRSYITGWEFDKIIRTQEELDAFKAEHPNYQHNGLSPELGMMVFKDLSGPDGKPDGIINDWDKVILKNSNNPVIYGLNLGGSWKGLSVDMMFSGQLGVDKWATDLAGGVEWNRMWKKWYNDSWTPENQNATLPKRISSNNAKTYETASSYWLKDASFMRLKYLTVSYDLPKNQFYNKLFDNVRFFVTGTNLFVLSSFNKNYYDPEIGNGNAFPILRSVNLGVDVKF